MNQQGERRLIAHLLQRLPGLRAVYLFGSTASGQAGAGSDVDLAVLGEVPMAAVDRFELASELADLVGRDVDLVDFGAASTVMRAQIIGHGRRLYGSGAELEDLEDRALADYARLNEERAGILQDVRARGSVYG